MVRIIRRDFGPRPVTEEDRAAFESRMLTFPEGRTPPPRMVQQTRQVVDAMVFPEHHSPIRSLMFGADGELWVERNDPDVQWVGSRYPAVPLDPTT